MNEIIVQDPKLHIGQKLILNHPARFKVASCGRRFGKSRLAGYWLALGKGSALDGKTVAYFTPTYKLLLDMWTSTERTLRPFIHRANRIDMRISLTTNGTIDFWTLENKDAGRGRKYSRVVIDEAAHARWLKEVWEMAISPTLVDLHGDAWFISTPRGINFFHELFQRGNDDTRPDWASFHMPSTTNPYIDAAEIESKRSELPELVFYQEYLAAFVNFGAGLVKPEHIILGDAPLRLQVVLGVDLAISEKETADWTAIVTMARDHVTGIVYIIEVERHRCGFNQILEHIKAAATRHKPIMIAVEQTQFQAAVVQELARTTRLPVRGVRPDRDKLMRFAPLLTRYERGMVRHDTSRVPAWFRDEILAFPNGQNDDAVDAAAYAFHALPDGITGTLKPIKTAMSGW